MINRALTIYLAVNVLFIMQFTRILLNQKTKKIHNC